MNDDEFGALLLRPLAGEPAGPPRIDVAKAMRDGRRLRRRRWWTGGTAFAAVTATAVAGGVLAAATDPDKPRPDLPPDPILPAACVLEVLPLGAHKSVDVTGGDPSGTYLVGSSDPVYGKKHAVLVWRDGKLIADVPVPGDELTMSDINGSGIAVGSTNGVPFYPVIYRDGKVSKLRGGLGRAVAINDAGVIVGMLGKYGEEVPARWATPDAEPQPLPIEGVQAGPFAQQVVDLAEDGTIAGSGGGGLSDGGYLWLPDGSRHGIKLPKIPGAAGFKPGAFRHGWLYGLVMLRVSAASSGPAVMDGDGMTPYRYDPRTETWQKLPDPPYGVQIAGGANLSALADPKIYVGDQILSLPPYAPAVENGDAFDIHALSDDARIVGGSTLSGRADPELDLRPLLWRCR
jgi:hypothetical protein